MDVMRELKTFLQVGTYSCITKPGMEMTSRHIYTEDHRHPAVYTTQCHAGHCNATQVTGREYVPVVLPCIPTHPSVDISIHKWKDSLPSGLYFLPESGYHIAEPEVALHNGTYLVVFKDVSGSKVKKLIIYLIRLFMMMKDNSKYPVIPDHDQSGKRAFRRNYLQSPWDHGTLGEWNSENMGLCEHGTLEVWDFGSMGLWEQGTLGA